MPRPIVWGRLRRGHPLVHWLTAAVLAVLTAVVVGGLTRSAAATRDQYGTRRPVVVAARDLPAGHVLTVEDIAIKSPNDGLPAFEFDNVIGMRLTAPLKADDNIRYEILEEAADKRPLQAAGARAQ